ncbi:MAG: U32 family peptidase, partial [Muribaculaceae bacterium]|nr:U32 family peptidase [Muribaculaceae bacterium]
MEDGKCTALKRSDFEIMAPAGSRESLHAAIAAGADSVYFGVEGLNMRSRSSANFTLADLKDIASICRENGVKSYLTLNTVVFDTDLDAVADTLDAVAESGVSAVIAADPAVIDMARERGVEVHISTQCNVTNIMAVKHYARVADVMVLARELDMDKVRDIYDAIVRDDVRGPGGKLVKIEMFCHGALCLAMSGKCYLSMHLMNSSANRGACTQICRRGYTVTDKETGDSLDVENQY